MSKETENEAQKPDGITDQELSKPPEAAKKKSFWSSDKFLSLFAFLVSMGTFFTFAYQTYLIQKQQYASMMPYLKLDVNSIKVNQTEVIQVVLINNGVGPAFIEDIKLHYQDSIYEQGPVTFFLNLLHQDSTNYSVSTYTIQPGDLIPAGKEWALLTVEDEYSLALMYQLSEEAILEITYSSIYGEKWQIENDTPPKKIE